MMVAGGTVEMVCLRLAWWHGGWRGRDWHGEGFFFFFGVVVVASVWVWLLCGF